LVALVARHSIDLREFAAAGSHTGPFIRLTHRTRIGSLRTRYAVDERDEIGSLQPTLFRVSHHNFNL